MATRQWRNTGPLRFQNTGDRSSKSDWLPRSGSGSGLREFLPPINIRRERQQTGTELVIAGRPQMAEGKAFVGAGEAQSGGKGSVRKSSKTKLKERKTML